MTVLSCVRMTKKKWILQSFYFLKMTGRNGCTNRRLYDRNAGSAAIIGMLAIGGVWGVRKAFTKHNANNLIEDVRLGGLIVVDEMLETVLNADGDVALNDKITPQTNYSFEAFAEENSTTTFGMLAQNIPFNFCEEARKRKADWLEYIWKY